MLTNSPVPYDLGAFSVITNLRIAFVRSTSVRGGGVVTMSRLSRRGSQPSGALTHWPTLRTVASAPPPVTQRPAIHSLTLTGDCLLSFGPCKVRDNISEAGVAMSGKLTLSEI